MGTHSLIYLKAAWWRNKAQEFPGSQLSHSHISDPYSFICSASLQQLSRKPLPTPPSPHLLPLLLCLKPSHPFLLPQAFTNPFFPHSYFFFTNPFFLTFLPTALPMSSYPLLLPFHCSQRSNPSDLLHPPYFSYPSHTLYHFILHTATPFYSYTPFYSPIDSPHPLTSLYLSLSYSPLLPSHTFILHSPYILLGPAQFPTPTSYSHLSPLSHITHPQIPTLRHAQKPLP